MQRYDIWVHYDELQEDQDCEGSWVRYDEAQAEIARLQDEVERLRSELAEALEGWHVEMPNSIAIHNAAIEKAAYLFTHPDEEGIADRIWELKE